MYYDDINLKNHIILIMQFLNKFNKSIDNGLSKAIFDHLRNLLICTFILAIGTTEIREQSSTIFTFFDSQYSGTGVIGVSILLMMLNVYDGIRKISNSKYHVVLSIGLVMLYLYLTVRVIEMAWNFRVTY